MGNIYSIFSFSLDPLFFRCLDCFFRETVYINKLEHNLDVLRTEMQELIPARNAEERRAIIAQQLERMEPIDPLKSWLLRVQTVEAKFTGIQEIESQEIEKLSSKSSYEFGKRVADTLKEVTELKSKRVLEIPEPAADEIPVEPNIVGQQSLFDKVWSCVNQEQVEIVGLYGPGGVGKTTILKLVNNSFCNNEGHPFDVVIWIVVSKDHKLEIVQKNIGKKIGLSGESWSRKNLEEKARDILKILKNKRFLLLLDDIWERVDLIKLGIPSQKASKVIFTTRSVAVCSLMGVHRRFEVQCLEDKEALDLFRKRVGSHILNCHPEIPKLAEMVVKECRGLPLALNAVGRAMARKEKLEEWEAAVEVLRQSAFKFEDMEKEIYSILNLNIWKKRYVLF